MSTEEKDPRDGCWITYYNDKSGIVAFNTEIEALRHGVNTGMQVEFRRWGYDLFRDSDERD